MILTLSDIKTLYSFFKDNLEQFTDSKLAVKNLMAK